MFLWCLFYVFQSASFLITDIEYFLILILLLQLLGLKISSSTSSIKVSKVLMFVFSQWIWYSSRKVIYFVEKCLCSEVLKIESQVKETSEKPTIIDNVNKSNTLTFDCRLVSFDIINMFPSIDSISGLGVKAVKSILDTM